MNLLQVPLSRGDIPVLELQERLNDLFTIRSDHLMLAGGRQSLLKRMAPKEGASIRVPSKMAEQTSTSL